MKKIEAIIKPGKVGEVCAALEKIGHPGIMITEIEGHGAQRGVEQEVRGKTYKVALLSKARIEIVVKDGDVEKMISAIIKAAYTGKVLKTTLRELPLPAPDVTTLCAAVAYSPTPAAQAIPPLP